MKFSVPAIHWHNKDPVLSVDFQPKTASSDELRLATGGTDSHVCIWFMKFTEAEAVSFEIAADLARHQKAVNVVRWSPDGVYLASGDDESIIFIWKQRTDKDPPPIFDQPDEQDKETWIIHKTLRGHVEDVYDISWSPTSNHLASGSVDNSIIFWDITGAQGKSTAILKDHKGFVQGVSWDPLNTYVASMSSDRVFRVFDVSSKKVVSRSSKAVLPLPEKHPLHSQTVRLYYDDTLQTYFRRLHFSPDGMLIAVPSGYLESDQNREFKPVHAVHIYTRHSLKTPACILPCGNAPALAVRWSPLLYKQRENGPKPAFNLGQKRMILAVATKTSIIVYDTQQNVPIAFVTNTHYTRMTDLTWSRDGRILVASSTDGFCSVITFAENELGQQAPVEVAKELPSTENVVNMDTSVNDKVTVIEKKDLPKPTKIEPKINLIAVKRKPTQPSAVIVIDDDSQDVKGENKPFIDPTSSPQELKHFKAPTKSTEMKAEKGKIPIELDVMDDVAMLSWSDDSNIDVKNQQKSTPMNVDDSTQEMKLVLDESSQCQPETGGGEAEKMDDKQLIKSPERLEKKEIPLVESILTTQSTASISSPKTPRRVSFVTLSSPKNPKKKC